ncbi:DUF5723 family protein [Neolewinella persica]|uniref:DUF5723 family protein n=1 Tax=Neolewinella persica TaxID=70998 RepID=UPI000364EA10|nr:DUF5723 family protein [Neolewinella persica]
MNCLSRYFLWLFLLISLSLSSDLYAQQQSGWALDPHAGLSAAFLQPAATAATPYSWDLNFGSFSGEISNNYIFLRNTAGLAFLREARTSNGIDLNDNELSFLLNGTRYNYDFPRDNKRAFARIATELTGPSFSVQVGQYTRIGAFTRLRGQGSTRGLDPDLNYYPYNEVPNGVDIPVDEAYAAGAVWGEVGLHLSRAFLSGNDGEIRFGVSPRYLLPLVGASGYNPGGGALRQVGEDSVVVINPATELGLSNAFTNENSELGVSGAGYAIDLGMQYAWGETDGPGYRYTVGVSLLDVGVLNFNRDAQRHRFADTGETLLVGDDYQFSGIDSVNYVLSTLSQQVNGTPDSQVGDEFNVGLPTAISVQFSYRPLEAVQFSASYRGDVPLGLRKLSRGEELATAVHYSRWWFGAGLTAGIYDWREFNVGLQARLGPVYLGTDRLFGSLLKTQKLDGGSFYLGLRIHDFAPGQKGKSGGRNRGRRNGGQRVKCYEF